MRILLNTNDQLTAAMMGNLLQANSLQADLTATPKDMMPVILRACRIDILVFYAELIDNNMLFDFFNKIKAADSNVKCVLLVRKEVMALVSVELENYFDEYLTLPLDTGDFMIRLRRLMRTAEQKGTQPGIQMVRDVEPPATPRRAEAPVIRQTPGVVRPEIRADAYNLPVFAAFTQPQPLPADNAQLPPPAFRQLEILRQPRFAPAEEEKKTEPAATVYPDAGTAAGPVPRTAENAAEERQDKTAGNEKEKIPAKNRRADKAKNKKRKSPLRRLNKTELLEILLEQEKIIAELNRKIEELSGQLENRELVMAESGSIAEAALKLNGVFEAAQKSADQYIKSVIGIAASKDRHISG